MDKYTGKRLDARYEIQELIGVGGMAVVYRAYDIIEDKIVAIKILKDEFLGNKEFIRRFKNESKAIAVLSHPNIVKVYDVSFGTKIQYIVMEYIEGTTLKEYISNQKVINWKDAVYFVHQILSALIHAHGKGVIHRDIKPQNIMLLNDGTIKVTDFGIARFSHNETQTMTDRAIGSVHYISPEQARGSIIDEKADLYSVGVMLYEMITGKLPFEADNAVSVAIMQMQANPKPPCEINPDIPKGLEQIILHSMEKESAHRYASAEEMLSDIEKFEDNPDITFDYSYFVDDNPTKYIDNIEGINKNKTNYGDGYNYKEEKKLITKHIISLTIFAFLLPGVVAILYFLVFRGNLQGLGLDADGYIIRNKITMIIAFIPFTLYYLVCKIKHKEIDFNVTFIISLLFYVILFMVMFLVNKISSYYYFKIYYLIWPFIIMASTYGIIMLLEKGKIRKIIAILLITAYVGTIGYLVLKKDYDFTNSLGNDEENISSVSEIFNINKKLIKEGTILSKEDLECIKYINDNLDSSEVLFVSHMRQQEWKQYLIIKSKPYCLNYGRLYEEIEDWNNGKYKYIAFLKDSSAYIGLQGKISLKNAKKIYSNNSTEIWEKETVTIE